MKTNKFKLEIPAKMDTTYQTHEYRGNVKKWDYCVVDQFGLVEEVYCKSCGDRIMGLREWGDPEVYQAKDEKATLVVRQRVRVLPFNNYSMVLMEMDDGSKHLTTCCINCADKMRDETTVEQLHDYYVADLASLADTSSTKRDLEVVDKLYERKPKRVL